MSYISLLLPSFKTKHINQRQIVIFVITQIKCCETQLGVGREKIELFKLIPLTPDETYSGELAAKLLNSNLSLKMIEELLRTNEKLKERLNDAKKSMITLSNKLNAMDSEYKLHQIQIKSNESIKELQFENISIQEMLETKVKNDTEFTKKLTECYKKLNDKFEDFIYVN